MNTLWWRTFALLWQRLRQLSRRVTARLLDASLAGPLRKASRKTITAAEQAPPCVPFPEIVDVLDALGAVCCCEPDLIARLSQVSKSTYVIVSTPIFAQRRAQEAAAEGVQSAKQCASLEELAICLKVANTFTLNHLYFPHGGGVRLCSESRPLLAAAAQVLLRHPQLRLHVDSHTGATAPSAVVADQTAQARAQEVVHRLLTAGVSREQLTWTAWGRRVSTRWSEPRFNIHSARAEMYFRLEGKEFPLRPDYYELVPKAKRPPEVQPGAVCDQPEPSDSDEDSSDEDLSGSELNLLDILRAERAQWVLEQQAEAEARL